MSLDSLTFLSALFGIFCIGREVLVIVHVKQIRITNLFLIMYGITYGIVLSLLLYFHKNDLYHIKEDYLLFDYSSTGLGYTTYWFLGAVVGYFSFRFANTLRFSRNTPETNLRNVISEEVVLYRLQITSVICLLIGIASFTIWTIGWGGYMNLFLNAAEIRNGSYGIRNPVAFFAKPAQIVATVSILSIYLIKKKKNIGFNVFLFIISTSISLMYYLAKDGRMTMAMYILIMLFMWDGTFEKQKKMGNKFLRLLFAFVIFIVVVLNMDTYTAGLRERSIVVAEDKTLLDSVMSELSYIYVAGQTAVKQYISQGCQWLIGHDVGATLFAWVPSSLKPEGLIDIWDYNTHLIAGINPVAQYPTDIISTSIYDLGIAGPFLLPAFWGAVIGKLDRIKKYNNTAFFTVVYCSVSMSIIRVVNYSMLSSTTAALFHIFVAAVVFRLCRINPKNVDKLGCNDL